MFWKRDGCRPLGRLLVVALIGIACFSVGAEAADAPNGWATCVGNDPEDCGDTVLTGGAGGSTVIATTGAQFKNLAEIIIAKHRNGPTGDVQLVFRKNLAKFENAATRDIDLSQVT